MLLCLSTAASGHTPEDRQKAIDLWEQAVAAKGGREQLTGIQSFAIRERTVFKRIFLRDIAAGRLDQIVCQLPNRWWEFLDYGPGRMGYSVRVVDTQTGLGWASHGAPAREFLRPDTSTAFRLRQLQYVYFLETRWVRPTPLRASRVRLGWKSVDRLDTQIADDLVVFYLDVSTHLPVRIETVHKFPVKPPRPGVTGTGQMKYVFELDDYREVSGIQVPSRLKLGGDTAESHVEINPEYDPSIFTTPPTPDATIDSWRNALLRR